MTTSPTRLGGLALAALLLAGVTACGEDDRPAEPAGAEPVNDTTAAAERLAGRYAHFDVVAYEGDGMKTLIVSYGLTDFDLADDELITTDRFCFSEHRSDQPISVQMSDAATQAIVPESTPVTLTVTDGIAHVSRPETPTPIGIDLEDPADEALPTDPNDPRIVDDDDDGHPGVTAHITVSDSLEGELYLARREIFAYEVDEQPDGTLTGSVDDHSEQLIVGASDPIFLTPAQWEQVDDPAKSPIILIPVEDDWDCDRLRAERDAIFPPTPEVDW